MANPSIVRASSIRTVGPSGDYPTIQLAIDAASNGDTVSVEAGTYDEQVVINGKDLTLSGAGDSTVIQPSTPAVLVMTYPYPVGTFWPGTVLASTILVENGANVTVKDLKVDGANVTSLPVGAGRLAGILYGESAGIITNVTVNNIKTAGYSARSYGIDVSAVGAAMAVEVSGNRVTDFSRDGIQIQGGSLTANVHDNTVTGPGTMAAGIVPNGILFIQGAAGNATSNTIHGSHAANPGDGSRTAGLLAYGSLGAVTFNSNNVFDVDDGIDLSGSNDVIVSSNNLHNNLETGIHLENGTTGSSITGNIFTGNGIAGIRFAGAADPTDIALCPVLLDCLDTPPGAGNVAHNNLSGSTVGVVNWDTGLGQTFDAANNWWGSLFGPAAGSVNGLVTTSPWCLDPSCATTTPSLSTVTTSANMSGLLSGNSVLLPENLNLSGGSLTVAIPSGTTITASGTWDGIFNAPTVQPVSSITIPTLSGFTNQVTEVLEIGSSSVSLQLDHAARLVFAGQADKKVGWVGVGGAFHEITATCSADSQSSADSLLAGSDCKISNDGSGNIVVWTKHFTTFAIYTQTANPAVLAATTTSSNTTTSTPSRRTYIALAPIVETPSVLAESTPSAEVATPSASPSAAPMSPATSGYHQ